MRVGAVIQARTGSTRLSGKVLKELPFGSGITVLEQVVSRLKRAATIDEIIIATTTAGDDDRIADMAASFGVSMFRGSEEDVLARFYGASVENSLDVVVRVTSDCPCIDPDVIDAVVRRRAAGGEDYVSNTLGSRTYPHGLDVEAFVFKALRRAHEEAVDSYDREHVTPYLYKSRKFSIAGVESPPELARPEIRITLDTEEDYALLCAVYDYLYDENAFFSHADIVGLFDSKPWLMAINGKVLQKSFVSSMQEEVAEAVRLLDLPGLFRASEALRKYEDTDKG